MCTCVISSLSNATVMSLSTNSPAETCDTLLLLVISVCCHFIYNLFVLQAYKIESSRRSLTVILGDPCDFTKMTTYSLLLYLLQDQNHMLLVTTDEIGGSSTLFNEAFCIYVCLHEYMFPNISKSFICREIKQTTFVFIQVRARIKSL